MRFLLLLLSALTNSCRSDSFIITLGHHSCMLHNNKTKCWGYNKYGQLGYGDTNNRGDEANEMGDILLGIDLGTNFIHSNANCDRNVSHLCLINTNNRGDEANEMGDILLEIDLGTNFIPMQIVAGAHHTCALSTGNKVKCWGYNVDGQLGYGD
eukprot:201349_1